MRKIRSHGTCSITVCKKMSHTRTANKKINQHTKITQVNKRNCFNRGYYISFLDYFSSFNLALLTIGSLSYRQVKPLDLHLATALKKLFKPNFIVMAHHVTCLKCAVRKCFKKAAMHKQQ